MDGYIYTFDIGSILFFTLTIVFYVRSRRVRDLTDQVFFAMLICGMIALVFDAAAASMEGHAMQHPKWLLYAVNMLFIAAMQACLPLFFIYTNVLAGTHYRISRKQHIAMLLPYMLVMLLLLISPFCSFGICTIDEAHIYRHGPTHLALYINTGVYIIASVSLLFARYQRIQRAQRNVIMLFVLLLFLAIGLQLLFPRYLLTASATALSLTSIFYVLQSPVDRIDPCTGACNRMLLPALLADHHGRKQSCTLVQFSLHSFDEIIRIYGSQLSDSLLRELATLLQNAFPRETVVYMDTWEFCVLFHGILSKDDVRSKARQIPKMMLVGGVHIPIDVHVSAVPSDDACDEKSTLVTGDYLLRQMRLAPTDDVLYADRVLREKYAVLLRFEGSLDAILRDGTHTLHFSPILRPDGVRAAEDVTLHIVHPGMQDVPYAHFLQALAQGGYVWQYYQSLFKLLAPQAARYSADCPACIQLSTAACMHDDAATRLYDLITAAGFTPSAITFFMHEDDVADALPMLYDNIRHLAGFGFGFRMDAFASGLTDLSQLTSLPVTAVKLDDSLLHDAREGGRQLALLSGTLRILRGLNISAVCTGVERVSDLENAVASGAMLLQGDYLAE